MTRRARGAAALASTFAGVTLVALAAYGFGHALGSEPVAPPTTIECAIYTDNPGRHFYP